MMDTESLPPLTRPPSYATIDPASHSGHDTTSDNFHVFELHHSSSTSTNLHIKQDGRVLYYAASYNTKDGPDVVLYAGYDAKGPRLGCTESILYSKDFKIYVGGLKTPVGDDWDIVRCARDGIFADSTHRFESSTTMPNGQRHKEKLHWQKTSDSKLGASKMSHKDYKLVDEITDEVVAVYVEHHMGTRTHKGTIRYRRQLGEMAEMSALMALLALLSDSRRYQRSVLRALAPGYGLA